jgi:hypothetical protein
MRMKLSKKKIDSWLFIFETPVGDIRLYLNKSRNCWSLGTIYYPHNLEYQYKAKAQDKALEWANGGTWKIS